MRAASRKKTQPASLATDFEYIANFVRGVQKPSAYHREKKVEK